VRHILIRALSEEFGVEVPTDNAVLLRQRLYEERRKDPQFWNLSILECPSNPDKLWIVRKRK